MKNKWAQLCFFLQALVSFTVGAEEAADCPPAKVFGDSFMAYAKGHGVTGAMRFDEAEFRVLYGTDGKAIVNLHNAYREFCNAGKADRSNVLNPYVAMMHQTPSLPATFTEAKAHLLPVIRARAFEEYRRSMLAENSIANSGGESFRLISGDAIILIAFDTDASIAIIGDTQFKKWGITFQVALEESMANLRRRSPADFREIAKGVYQGTWGDSYDASRLLLADELLKTPIGPDVTVMIPTRGVFLATAANDARAQRAMLDFAMKAAQDEGRTVSSAIYHFPAGRPAEFILRDSSARLKQLGLKRIYLIEDYQTQKNELEKQFEKSGSPIFVASYTVFRDKQGRVFSACSWTEGVDSLLPVTDAIGFVGDARNSEKRLIKMVNWSDAIAGLGNLMEKVEGYPTRYRVKTFPDPKTLEALKERE